MKIAPGKYHRRVWVTEKKRLGASCGGVRGSLSGRTILDNVGFADDDLALGGADSDIVFD